MRIHLHEQQNDKKEKEEKQILISPLDILQKYIMYIYV